MYVSESRSSRLDEQWYGVIKINGQTIITSVANGVRSGSVVSMQYCSNSYECIGKKLCEKVWSDTMKNSRNLVTIWVF